MSFHKKDQWGEIVRPGQAYQGFKRLRKGGWYACNLTWRQHCAHFRKRIRKNQIAKESRRRNRRK